MTRKIAIVGTAEPHWRNAPFQDDEWTIWTCGGVFATAPRSDRHFELHRRDETCKGWGQGTPEQEAASREVYWNWLERMGEKVILRGTTADCPDAQVYPLDEILTLFPDKYFTNTISYMVALALKEGLTDLGLWGVDMALTGDPDVPESNEYSRQRPSVEFLLGIATGMGVTVHLPSQTTLLKTRKLYAFDDDDGFNAMCQAKIDELKGRVAEGKKARAHLKAQLAQADQMIAAMETGAEIAGYLKRNAE